MAKVQLFELLIDKGFYKDKAEVERAVIAGDVIVDDTRMKSACEKVSPESDIRIKTKGRFVSRGGEKLQGALDAFGLDFAGLRCVDIGSSTGGFTDCLLQNGAGEVTCVDVGYGDLSWTLRSDDRVKVFERTNIRFADVKELGAPFDVIVIDVSFIGLAGLVDKLAELSKPHTALVALVKPQFESAHDETDKGVVRSEEVRLRTVDEVSCALGAAGFKVKDHCQSPIKGPAGNIEYLIYAIYGGNDFKDGMQ